MPSQDVFLAVQRQMIPVLAGDHLGQQARTGQALVNRLGRLGRDRHVLLTRWAGVLAPHELADEQRGWDILQLLADLLAERHPNLAAAGADPLLLREFTLTRALQEYGRLIKTIFILRYLESEDYRRRINAQLNKGESLHSLREFLFFANRGKVRRKQEEEQAHQALCLNVLTNAVVAWNTVYMAAAIEQIRREGHPVQDADLVHLAPARYEHINPYGKYRFAVDEELNRTGLRPLRRP